MSDLLASAFISIFDVEVTAGLINNGRKKILNLEKIHQFFLQRGSSDDSVNQENETEDKEVSNGKNQADINFVTPTNEIKVNDVSKEHGKLQEFKVFIQIFDKRFAIKCVLNDTFHVVKMN